MQGYLPTIVAMAGSYLAVWFLINCIVPIKRLGIKSRKVAFIFLTFTLIVVGVANNYRGDEKSSDEERTALPDPGPVPVTLPKEDKRDDILQLANDKSRQDIWIAKGQQAVQEKLKDPSSAQFRKYFFHLAKLDEGYAPVSCGQVNSKNSLGGYIGFQRYISTGKAELTFLEEEMADFERAWKMMCVD